MNISNRILGLDILRAIAILLVVFGHAIWLLYGLFTPNTLGDTLFIFTASSCGYIGVEVFFVLSGFLIGSIFIKEIVRQSSDFHLQSIKYFWVKRWFRTLPNYYLYVLIYIAVYWAMGWTGIEGFTWKYLVFIHNLFATGPGFIYVAWSLAVEEWFYLLLPVFFTIFFLTLKNKVIAFKMTIVLLFLIPFIARIGYVFAHPLDQSFTPHLGFATLYRLDSIAYGIFFALLWSKEHIKQVLMSYKTKFLVLGLSLFAAFLVYMILFISKPIQNPILVLIAYPFLTTSITLCFPYMASLKLGKPTKIKQYITFVSLISYSLYLAHPIFIRFFDTLKNEQNPPILVCFGYFMATIALSVGCSYITYSLCEKVFLNIRDRWMNESRRDLTISKN